MFKEIHMYRTASALIAASIFTAQGWAQAQMPLTAGSPEKYTMSVSNPVGPAAER